MENLYNEFYTASENLNYSTASSVSMSSVNNANENNNSDAEAEALNVKECLLCGSRQSSLFQVSPQKLTEWSKYFQILTKVNLNNNNHNCHSHNNKLNDQINNESVLIEDIVRNSLFCIDCHKEIQSIFNIYSTVHELNVKLSEIKSHCEIKLKELISLPLICSPLSSSSAAPESISISVRDEENEKFRFRSVLYKFMLLNDRDDASNQNEVEVETQSINTEDSSNRIENGTHFNGEDIMSVADPIQNVASKRKFEILDSKYSIQIGNDTDADADINIDAGVVLNNGNDNDNEDHQELHDVNLSHQEKSAKSPKLEIRSSKIPHEYQNHPEPNQTTLPRSALSMSLRSCKRSLRDTKPVQMENPVNNTNTCSSQRNIKKFKFNNLLENEIEPEHEPEIISRLNSIKNLKKSETRLKLDIVCEYPNCKKKFLLDEHRDAHMKRYHEGQKNPYSCPSPSCTYACHSLELLRQHSNIHSGLHPYPCPEKSCLEKFPTNQRLQDHRRRQHRPKKFKCSLDASCRKVFLTENRLNDHLRSHTKERPFPCEICGKSFAHKIGLQNHRYTHPELDLDRIKCSFCGKLIPKITFKIHEQTHTGNSKYSCELNSCGFVGSNKHSLTRHMMDHSGERPFQCGICSHSYKTIYDLNRHKKLVHPATKDFMCSECGKCFSNKRYLREHEEIHKEIKSFLCSVCGKYFTQQSSLKSHVKSIHGKVEIEDGDADADGTADKSESVDGTGTIMVMKICSSDNTNEIIEVEVDELYQQL